MCLAVPGQIKTIMDEGPLRRHGFVQFGGIQKEVSLALVPEAEIGDYVLVHAGLAIGLVDENEAAEVFAALDQLEAVQKTLP